MNEIIKALSKEKLVGLHTVVSNDDEMYCGKILQYNDKLLHFQAYDINGEDYVIQVESEDIVWIEKNSADIELLAKIIACKDIFPEKKQITVTGSNIRKKLYYLWENEIPAVYHVGKKEYEAYLIGYDRKTIVLHSFSSDYNVDYGIVCFPINELKIVEIYTPALNRYPIIYENHVKADKLDINSTNIQHDFLFKCMNNHLLVDMQNQMDTKDEVCLIGYVESIETDIVRIRKINSDGIDCGLECYNIKDIANFGFGGLYLDKIEYYHTKELAKKAKDEIIIINNMDELKSLLLDAKEKCSVISLISNETEEEYNESTGIIIDVMGDWFHMTMYDDIEDHWFECYHKILDYSKLRRNSIRELFIEAKMRRRMGARTAEELHLESGVSR